MFTHARSRTILFATLLGGALLLPTATLADHHEDTMQEGGSMAQDAMAGEAMAGEAMAEEAPMKSEEDDEMIMEEDKATMEGENEM